MAESRVITSFQLNNGDVIRKTEDSDGQIRYRRASVQSGKGGQFISNQQGETLERLAAGGSGTSKKQQTKGQQITFVVKPQNETERQETIEKAFPRWNQTTNLDPDVIPANSPQMINSIRAWMENDTVEQQIENNPLLKTEAERDRAKEARAREIVADLQNARTEQEAKFTILKSYGIY
jgi:hypothetical protein